MAKARTGGSIKSKLGFLIYGKQGTWKSSMCLEFAKFKREDGKPFRVLYLDPEFGSIDDYIDGLAERGIDPNNIYIVYTQSLGEVREYIKKATLNEDFYELDDDGNETDIVVTDTDGEPFRVDAIVVDGASVLYIATQQGLVEFSQKRALVKAKRKELAGIEKIVATAEAGLERLDWNRLATKGQDLILDLNASGKHWAITARETFEREQVEVTDKDGNKSYMNVSTGISIPEGFKNMGYNAKTVLHMIMNEDGEVQAIIENKDRSGVHKQNQLLEAPTLMDWSVVIEKNKNREDFVLANGMGESVKIEQKIYEEEILAMEAEFDEPPFDTSDDTNKTSNAKQLQENISKIMKGMDVDKRKTLKTRLTSQGLPFKPTEIKETTDIKTLEQILVVISK